MDNDQIHATITANNAAVATGDMDAILATFEPSGALVGGPGALAQGSSALRAAFEQFIAIKPQISITDHDVIQADDIAVHSSTWTMSGETPDGHSIAQSGFSIVILRKQKDGRWLMVIDNPFADHLLQKAAG